MNIKDAVQSLGVRDDTLSGEEKRRLDEDGYVFLSNMLSDAQVRALAGRLDELLEEEANDQKISRILTKGASGANYAMTWHHQDWKKFSQSVSAQMTGGFFIASSTRKNPLEANIWYNLVGSYNGREMKIYVDTELRNARTWSGTPITAHNNLTIGAMSGRDGQEGFEGVIDEVKIYNRALTEAEIARNYERALAMAVENSPEKLALTWGELKRTR